MADRRLHLLIQQRVQATNQRRPVRRSKDETYRNYRLMAGQRGDGFSSVAYAGKTRVFSGSGSDLDGALDDVKTQIDKDFASRKARLDSGGLSPEDFELALALCARKITATLEQFLPMLHGGPSLPLSQAERRASVDRETLRAELLRLARAIANVLNLAGPKSSDNTFSALNLMVETISARGSTDETWTFRPSFVKAVLRHLER